ncbi:hypothetical protein CY35_07G049200 [Sphagnum magellanicum]|uniref:Uncharacterized protein n=1 Tax=Sphagnum magellanicum TaxID=128215 RepID=A0ACB8HKP4_9BRYO|nr:hypothetical protein CY35_07G049200 [Sphagnum magellanicum]
MGFVTQDDVMFPMLTVRESLLFAALLRLPNSMTRIQKIQRADTVLKELGLERCKNTIIGGTFVRGVSGGERKRTSIGYEILVDPSLLYLDEPTSGLDSTTALRILKVLQKNAQVGRGIVATIHQPSSRMFHMFDKLILLSEGYAIFAGYAKDAMDYFSSLSLTPQIAMNPADFLLDLATGTTSDITIPPDLENLITQMDLIPPPCAAAAAIGEDYHAPPSSSSTTSSPAITCKQIGLTMRDESRSTSPEDFQRDLVHKYMRRKYMTRLAPEERRAMCEMGNVSKELEDAIKAKQDWASSWWTQFLILFKRTFNERRVDYFSSLKILQAIGVAVLLGLLWWRSKTQTNADIQDQATSNPIAHCENEICEILPMSILLLSLLKRYIILSPKSDEEFLGLIFYICIFWATFSMWTTLMTFPMERQYLAKERAADMYRLSAYYMSSTVCDCLAELVFPTIFLVILYFMASLRASVGAFFLTLLATFLIGITGQALNSSPNPSPLQPFQNSITCIGFGEMFGAATLSLKTAGIIASMFLLVFLLAGGYYVQKMPAFMKWVKYLSFVYYGFRLLQKIQYSPDQIFNCDTTSGCESIANARALQGLPLDSGVQEAWVLVLMAVGYRLISYLCLRRI